MSSPETRAAIRKPGAAARTLAWLRRALLLYAALAVIYLSWRFELQKLPSEGVSPLLEYRPGAHLLVDRRRLEAQPGEALLFRDESGRLLLARLGAKPAGEARPGLWLVADDPQARLPDSRSLGPIPPTRVVGRVVCALPLIE